MTEKKIKIIKLFLKNIKKRYGITFYEEEGMTEEEFDEINPGVKEKLEEKKAKHNETMRRWRDKHVIGQKKKYEELISSLQKEVNFLKENNVDKFKISELSIQEKIQLIRMNYVKDGEYLVKKGDEENEEEEISFD